MVGYYYILTGMSLLKKVRLKTAIRSKEWTTTSLGSELPSTPTLVPFVIRSCDVPPGEKNRGAD